VLAFVVAVFAAFAGGALWSSAGRAEPAPESPPGYAASASSPEQSAPIAAATPKSEPSISPTAVATEAPAPTPEPPPTATPLPPPVPTATSTPEPPTPTPTATAASAPAPVAVAPVNSDFCGDASARITDLDKRGPPEVVTITGAGDLTGWYLVSVRGAQRFDFPDGFVLDGSVRVLSGAEPEPDTAGELHWSGQNLWNNAEDDDAELYDCADALASAFDDGD
jgi:hypothetical protein